MKALELSNFRFDPSFSVLNTEIKILINILPFFVSLQIIYALMFAVVIALVSDALRTSHLSSDVSFRQEFHELVRWSYLSIQLYSVLFFFFFLSINAWLTYDKC